MPPWWKIRRELVRPFRQLKELPENIATRLFGSLYFDRFKKVSVFAGGKKAGKKAAVFVIFPSAGHIQSTHLRSIRFLTENGYSVTLVSNAPVNETSINRVLSEVSKFIIRPNFGYDFGGYRQGVLDLLGDSDVKLSHLMLVNDSCWFPTIRNSDWISKAEDEKKDLVGLTSNYGVSRKWESNGEVDWNYSTSHKNFHYCSFALLFSERAIYNEKFQVFWKRFPLTSNKSRVVRRGEIGLTQLIIKHGLTHGETLKINSLDKRLQELSEKQSKEIFNMLIIPEHRHLKLAFDDLKNSPLLTKEQVDGFILRSVAVQGASYGLAFYMNTSEKVPFLKKSPMRSDEDSKTKMLTIIDLLEPEIRQEIKTELLR